MVERAVAIVLLLHDTQNDLEKWCNIRASKAMSKAIEFFKGKIMWILCVCVCPVHHIPLFVCVEFSSCTRTSVLRNDLLGLYAVLSAERSRCIRFVCQVEAARQSILRRLSSRKMIADLMALVSRLMQLACLTI